ncbi:DUF5711 family protein [Calorimonas adulescens]|uniref:PQQ-binding-like beta-propeller repeat protein n=1 Tax=Calorimonas adulescens TaxID=2606906 RepID=A0A5D8Q9I4_9THEO|nr:DUF5711 family protein [Calorimonas adulescens]TZE80844.1 hypothetical protein FWJ32_11620 [Calorimonas adulescens]
MKRFFVLLIAVMVAYYIFSGMSTDSREVMDLKAQITYDSYTNFVSDVDGWWGYREGEVLHYTGEGINDFKIKVNASEPVLSVGDMLAVYEDGGDTLYVYDMSGKELWEYKAGGSIEDVILKPGENIFILYLKDRIFYMIELNNDGKKVNEWIASNDFVMGCDLGGGTMYVASANTDELGGRITAYTKKGELIWAQELPGLIPFQVKAFEEGVSVILDKKVMSLSSKGKTMMERDMAVDYGCIGYDGSIYGGSNGTLNGLAVDGRELFSIKLPGIDGVYPDDEGVVVLSGRSITQYDTRGKAIASYEAMRDIDYLVPVSGKKKILAVGRSGADLVEVPLGVLK